MSELRLAYSSSQLWIYLAMSDIRNRFRRSKLGIIWPILQQLAFSLGAGYIWSKVFSVNASEFIPFLAIGFAIWGFLTACLTEGCMTFVVAHGYLKQLPLPQSVFIFRTLFAQLIYFAIAYFVTLTVLAFYDQLTIAGIVFSIPGLAILILFGYGSIGTFSYLGLKYRDLPHALQSVLNILFIVTPVIYPSEVLIKKGLSLAAYLNPLVSLIDIVRVPLLDGKMADELSYLIAITFSFGLIVIRFILQKKWGKLVAFWS